MLTRRGSCWQPIPLRPRKKPPVTSVAIDQKLAVEKLATCVVTDIYHGMENVERGTIKYIRVMEQVPRPWADLAPVVDETQPQVEEASADGDAQAPCERSTKTLLPADIGTETDELLPYAPLQPAQPLPTPEAPAQSPAADDLHRDAEELRLKGMALMTSDPSMARKYLLASTVLRKDNAEVWIALIGMASSAKEREVYRQQAGKILSAEHTLPTS